MKIRLFAIALLCACVSMPTWSQDSNVIVNPNTPLDTRNLGSQLVELSLGIGIPLWSGPDDNGGITPGANLDLGFALGFKYSAFLDNSIALGLDISGLITAGPNKDSFYAIPIGVRISNYFRLSEDFQLPISLTAALNIMRYKDLSYIGFALKPGISLIWDATKDWSFALNVIWWWMPEWYTDPNGTPPTTQTRSAHSLEITLSVINNF